MNKFLIIISLLLAFLSNAQEKILAPTPPMGFMTWNYFATDINEESLKEIIDELVLSGLRDAGFNYLFIDDGWQGGRDSQNNIIPDYKKFPSGLKSLADYAHSKGLKIGIYSDAAPLTCGGYTGSLHFEEQDAKQFASCGFDYLKYDYCGAPEDWQTAINRYEKMSNALKATGRDIVFSICEWGDRHPYLWAKKAGGHLWRTTADIRDKWKSLKPWNKQSQLHSLGAGILDVVNINAELNNYASSGAWNDPDMLVVGLYGRKGPSGSLGGVGCSNVEYQSQMSLWCLMASPLMISCDIRNMNLATRNILLNKDIIAINQDPLAVQASRKLNDNTWQVFVKPLSNGNVALGILNISDANQTANINLQKLGIYHKTSAFDVWSKNTFSIDNVIKINVSSHETKVFVLK